MELWRVSSTEVKNSWGQVVRRILQRHQPALVESKGMPTVVILPADDYERLIAEQGSKNRQTRQLLLLEEAERSAKKVAACYLDQPKFDAVEIIREMREERDAELLGLR